MNESNGKKIAICFFGLGFGVGYRERVARPFESYENNKEKIIKNHDCDIFFHSWIDNKDTEKKLVKKIKPKKYIVQTPIKFDIDAKYHDKNLYPNYNETRIKDNFKLNGKSRHLELSQAHTREKSLELAFENMKEENKEYDFIILLRNDLYFKNDISLKNLDKDKLYLMYNPKHNNYCDMLFIGSPKSMKCFLNVREYIKKVYKEEKNHIVNNENTLYKFFKLNNLDLSRFIKYNEQVFLNRYKNRNVII